MSLLKRIFRHFYKNEKECVQYTIGNRKEHNSLIDTLTPQFVKIGDNFISAPGSMILAHDASTFIFTEKYVVKPTIVGDNVFLGAGAIILPGVRIGNNVIIGAGSIISKNIPDNVVVAGNPAKIICKLEDYLIKHENELYKSPYSMADIISNGISKKDILEFQRMCIERIANEDIENSYNWIYDKQLSSNE